jgi:transcriptional regulator with GAF, ATPase, and Fis domain
MEQFLHELAVLSTRVVTDGLSCGMALRQRGRPPATTACTDPLASEADEIQYRTGDGPCLHAVRHAQVVHIHDMAAHGRWPRFARQAMSLGIRSCLAAPLIADGEPVGALTMYARRPRAFGPAETGRARRFAKHASGALTQALGVIMATEHVPQDKAFALLRTVSQNTNVKLRDLAADIVTSASGERPRPAAPFEDS